MTMRRVIGGAVHAQLRVDAAHDHVEPLQQVLVLVEGAVLEDVDLHAGEDAEGGQLLVELGDDIELLQQAVTVEAVGHREPGRVVGQDHVLVAEVLGRAGHDLDRRAAVGPVRVQVAVAPQRRPVAGALGCHRQLERASSVARYAGTSPRTASVITAPVLAPMPDTSCRRPLSTRRPHLVVAQLGRRPRGPAGRPGPWVTAPACDRAGRRCGRGRRRAGSAVRAAGRGGGHPCPHAVGLPPEHVSLMTRRRCLVRVDTRQPGGVDSHAKWTAQWLPRGRGSTDEQFIHAPARAPAGHRDDGRPDRGSGLGAVPEPGLGHGRRDQGLDEDAMPGRWADHGQLHGESHARDRSDRRPALHAAHQHAGGAGRDDARRARQRAHRHDSHARRPVVRR